jgi:hypothetical protein
VSQYVLVSSTLVGLRPDITCPRSKLLHNSQSVSQYVLVSSILVGLVTRYYFLSECYCLIFAVLYLWGALSDERTGLQFAVQSFNGPSRSEPETTLYCLMEGQVPVFISPRNRVAVIPPGTGLKIWQINKICDEWMNAVNCVSTWAPKKFQLCRNGFKISLFKFNFVLPYFSIDNAHPKRIRRLALELGSKERVRRNYLKARALLVVIVAILNLMNFLDLNSLMFNKYYVILLSYT